MSLSMGLPGQPFVLGVNYWPRRKAMFWWSDFDAAEVRDEFAMVRDLGMDLLRIFLLWDDLPLRAHDGALRQTDSGRGVWRLYDHAVRLYRNYRASIYQPR